MWFKRVCSNSLGLGHRKQVDDFPPANNNSIINNHFCVRHVPWWCVLVERVESLSHLRKNLFQVASLSHRHDDWLGTNSTDEAHFLDPRRRKLFFTRPWVPSGQERKARKLERCTFKGSSIVDKVNNSYRSRNVWVDRKNEAFSSNLLGLGRPRPWSTRSCHTTRKAAPSQWCPWRIWCGRQCNIWFRIHGADELSM